MRTRLSIAILLSAALGAGAAAAATDPGTLTRAESLRAKPFADAKLVAPAAAGSKVEIIGRNGGWYQVKAGRHTGWVRMLSVRRSAAPTTSAQGIAAVASGRTGTGTVVTTTGVRGLDAQALATAAYDADQVARAEALRIGRREAEDFARTGGLQPRDVANLPAPRK